LICANCRNNDKTNTAHVFVSHDRNWLKRSWKNKLGRTHLSCHRVPMLWLNQEPSRGPARRCWSLSHVRRFRTPKTGPERSMEMEVISWVYLSVTSKHLQNCWVTRFWTKTMFHRTHRTQTDSQLPRRSLSSGVRLCPPFRCRSMIHKTEGFHEFPVSGFFPGEAIEILIVLRFLGS
jgi:hypothetical protein